MTVNSTTQTVWDEIVSREFFGKDTPYSGTRNNRLSYLIDFMGDLDAHSGICFDFLYHH